MGDRSVDRLALLVVTVTCLASCGGSPDAEGAGSGGAALPTAQDEAGDVIQVTGTPPLFEGGETPLTPPLSVLQLASDQIVRADESWTVAPAVDRDLVIEQPAGSLPRPSEPIWYLLCLTQGEGRFCEPALVDAHVAGVHLAGDGGTVVICDDRSVIEVAILEQQPQPVCT
ncbi:hypothetical protein [Euzebya tangerina]|uniref:hypothetical protein n=1 Tax=Euzebya tangerina TaxID=591198 RepID=UPI0013C2EA95|nr:hypothetical protein [Euzebya tangerina]